MADSVSNFIIAEFFWVHECFSVPSGLIQWFLSHFTTGTWFSGYYWYMWDWSTGYWCKNDHFTYAQNSRYNSVNIFFFWFSLFWKRKIRDCLFLLLHPQPGCITFETNYSEIKHDMIYWCSVFTRIVKYALSETSEFWARSCDSPKTENRQAFTVKAINSHHPNWMEDEFSPNSRTE